MFVFRVIKKSFLFLLVFCWFVGFSQSAGLKFKHLNVNNGLPQNSVYSIVKDKYGFIWLGTWGGAVRYDGYTTKVFRPVANDATASLDYRISCIVTDRSKNIWIETENREVCYQYNYEKENFTQYPKSKIPVEVDQEIRKWHSAYFKQTANSTYQWETLDDGLKQINKKTAAVILYKSELSNPFALSDNVTKNVFLDNQDNLWVGTLSGGVSYANLYQKPFVNYHMDDSGRGLIDNSVRVIAKDKKGQIWLGSENKGITIINRIGGKLSYQYIDSKVLPNLQIRSLFCDSQNNMWVGTKKGIFVIKDGKLLKKANYDTAVLNDKIFQIAEDNQHNLWIGTLDGLVLYDAKKEKFTPFLRNQKAIGEYIRCIVQDKKQHIWIATEDLGVTELIPKILKNGALAYKLNHYSSGKDKSLPSNRTYSLTVDKLNHVWVATDRGLCVINPDSQKVKTFGSESNLPDNLIMAVQYDGENSVWVSHEKGLSKIDIASHKSLNYNVSDGLQINGFNQNASFFDSETKEMFFGGGNGLTSFYPEKIKTNPYPPQIVLSDLRIMHQKVNIDEPVNKRVVLEKSLLCTDTITLSWWDKVFEIEFAALHYANASENKYKYKLEGFDKNWVQTTAQDRKAVYSNLASGTYIFKVMAANSDGVWNPKARSLVIKVLPPWWLSVWAITGYVILGLMLLWLIKNYIVSRVKLHQKEEMHQLKLRFFTEVSHEFRTPLTLIVDPLEKLINKEVSKDKLPQYYQIMHRNTKQLLLLINQLLDFQKLESGRFSLNLQAVDLVKFVKEVVGTFAPQAVTKNISLTVLTQLDNLWVNADEQKLNMVLNNLLSNAFKFTPENGKIVIWLSYSDESQTAVCLQVEDSGIGMPSKDLDKIFELFYQTENGQKNQLGSGIGLALTKELVELHNGTITVKSEEGFGTIFTVILPCYAAETVNNKVEITAANQSENSEEAIAAEPINNEQLVLLFVDDNEDIRSYIEFNFSEQYQLLLAKNGKEGLELALKHVPDIIISDVMMPDMNGLELCHHIKKNKITSHIPLILLTAKNSDEAKIEGYQTGADAYLSKPFSTDVLEARITNLLEQRKLLQTLFANNLKAEVKNKKANTADEIFINEVRTIVESNLENPQFDIDFLADKMGMSRSQFYRKMKALTNKPANDFIVELQMEKAVEYLLSGSFNISETAYKLGYSSPNSFTRAFSKHFGMTPTQYIEKFKQLL